MSDPWDMTPAQRQQFREAHAEAKRNRRKKAAMQEQYGIRWATGVVFSYASRADAEYALSKVDATPGVLVVHEYEPGTPNSTEWREVALP